MLNVDNLASNRLLMNDSIPNDGPERTTPSILKIQRKFDLMFPGIGYENYMYERDLLSHGSMTAAFNRNVREETNRNNLLEKLRIDNKKPLAEVLDSIIVGDDAFFVVAKDKDDQPIIDHEKKTVTFFNRETKEEILVEFLTDEKTTVQANAQET